MNAPTLSRISLALSALALVGTIAAFATKGTSPAAGTDKKERTTATPPVNGAPAGNRVAYVDIDTLETHYQYFKDKKAEFTRRQQSIESELQRSALQLQNQAADFQKKANSGGFTSQAEAESAGRRLQQMEQSLTTRRETLAAALLKDQDAFNAELQKRLDDFLEDYVKDKPYDYVLSYSKNGSILYANQALNITADVIGGMNARVKDTAKVR